MKVHPIFASCYKGLIVSCQALEDEPLHGSIFMAAMARAAHQGGAVGIRANTPGDIHAIHLAVKLPVVGLYKQAIPGFAPYITPTLDAAVQIAHAGADIIAVDATLRPHPRHLSGADLIQAVKIATGKPVLADVDTLEAGLAAVAAGADAVSTTLSGYTDRSPQLESPDFELVAHLAARLEVPTLAEGRYTRPDEVIRAMDLGAYAAVVGGAITRPREITQRFCSAIEQHFFAGV